MEQERDLSTSKVIAPNKTKTVEVTCLFHYKTLQLIFNIEDNLFVKDLRKIIQDHPEHQEPVALVKDSNNEHLEDDQMICDVSETDPDDVEPNRVLRVTVYQFLTISFYEKNGRVHTNTESKDEIYVVKSNSETVQMMLNKFNSRELKQYRLHPTMNNLSSSGSKKIRKDTVLLSLDSGSTIHVEDDENGNCVLN